MICLIILTLLSIAATITLAVYIKKLKKNFKYQIDTERNKLQNLEEFFLMFYKEYNEHMKKYH